MNILESKEVMILGIISLIGWYFVGIFGIFSREIILLTFMINTFIIGVGLGSYLTNKDNSASTKPSMTEDSAELSTVARVGPSLDARDKPRHTLNSRRKK